MGGGGDPIQAVVDLVRDTTETVVTGGANLTEEGKKIKRAGQGFIDATTGEAAREAAAKGKSEALANEAKNAAKLAAQEEKMKAQQDFAKRRSRQKSLMGGNSGRSSTILTSPLGVPPTSASAGGKTALGQ